MKGWGVLAALAAAAATSTLALAAPFDASPWLADLEQTRQAFQEKYANLDWLQSEREVDVDKLFDDLAKRLNRAQSEAQAMAVFDRLVQKVGDGHVDIRWPEPKPAVPPTAGVAAPAPDLCRTIGYDQRQNTPGTARGLAGYAQLPSAGNPFQAATVTVGDRKLGVLRIGVFQPQGFPELCRDAVRALAVPADKPCDDECQNRIVTFAYRRLTEALEQRVRQLKAAGATTLLVDITDNGGGSEWAEAAARIFSPRQLVSERRGFVRGEHWANQWRDLSAQLREFAKGAPRADKQRLLGWAAESDTALKAAQTPCPATSEACTRLATAGYSTGLVGSAPASALQGKEWGVLVFSPSQFPYHDGVWDGPLVILTDQETWSAAEEFAAVLQDNRAAVVLGARTGGAGCGHTWGGTPTKLSNSGAVLELPDCVRFRADGSNEVRGVLPDVPVALRANDGLRLRARLIAEKLPSAIAQAEALARAR
jgi:hypothetical protein